MNLRRIFLYLLIASVAASAVIGIVVILLGNFGELETKVLLTAGTVTLTSILGLACGAYLESGRGRAVPISGIALAVASAVMWMFIIWDWQRQSEMFVKSLMTVTLVAVACSLVSLLSLARLDRRFIWSRYLANGSIALLSGYLIFLIWTEYNISEDVTGRIIGVLSIIVAALTVATPVFHKLSSEQANLAKIDAEIEVLRSKIVDLKKRRDEIISHSGPAE